MADCFIIVTVNPYIELTLNSFSIGSSRVKLVEYRPDAGFPKVFEHSTMILSMLCISRYYADFEWDT